MKTLGTMRSIGRCVGVTKGLDLCACYEIMNTNSFE